MDQEKSKNNVEDIIKDYNEKSSQTRDEFKEKNEKISKKSNKKIAISIGVSTLVIAAIALVNTLTTQIEFEKYQKVSNALEIQNVDASLSTIMTIENEFGKDISGKDVINYINYFDNDDDVITRIGDVFISSDGQKFDNTMEKSLVRITKDGKYIEFYSFEDNKIFEDQKNQIQTVSYSDIEENYVLSFEKNNDNTYSYKLVKKANS